LSTEEVAMRAKAGDRMVISGHRVGQPDRLARILAVKGPHGEPPYLVQWADDGHEALVYPGSDARIEHKRAKPTGESDR
jgi:Domain of unknown function (DUF1918)